MSTRQLAVIAGVAPVTVSMALRDHPRISLATRERIKALARCHGYRVDGRVTELMRSIRRHSADTPCGCLALISLYETARPWELSGKPNLDRLRSGILERAAELGYRVEDFWLRGPGMSAGRIRDIFYNRAIEGVICIGAPTMRVELPPELIEFTVVTAGLSISSPVHRVQAHSSGDATRLLEELKARGYERPGVFLSTEYDSRSGHLTSAMYLYQVRHLFDASDIPILYAGDTVDGGEFMAWYRTHRPDVVIVNANSYFEAAQQWLALAGLEVPRDVGFAGIQFPVEGQGLSGVLQDNHVLGREAVDLLVGRLQSRELGLPPIPKIELVAGHWLEGTTLAAKSRGKVG